MSPHIRARRARRVEAAGYAPRIDQGSIRALVHAKRTCAAVVDAHEHEPVRASDKALPLSGWPAVASPQFDSARALCGRSGRQ